MYDLYDLPKDIEEYIKHYAEERDAWNEAVENADYNED